jgi:hypothetical protein
MSAFPSKFKKVFSTTASFLLHSLRLSVLVALSPHCLVVSLFLSFVCVVQFKMDKGAWQSRARTCLSLFLQKFKKCFPQPLLFLLSSFLLSFLLLSYLVVFSCLLFSYLALSFLLLSFLLLSSLILSRLFLSCFLLSYLTTNPLNP